MTGRRPTDTLVQYPKGYSKKSQQRELQGLHTVLCTNHDPQVSGPWVVSETKRLQTHRHTVLYIKKDRKGTGILLEFNNSLDPFRPVICHVAHLIKWNFKMFFIPATFFNYAIFKHTCCMYTIISNSALKRPAWLTSLLHSQTCSLAILFSNLSALITP